MDQIRNLADDRLVNGCSYCGGPEETRDHVPSRVLLEEPLPENLPVVPACDSCNRGFSSDEEYVACLIESVVAGSTDPERIARPGVARILHRQVALRARIEAQRIVTNGQVSFGVEVERLRNIVVKLARGHSTFELSQPCRDEPSDVWWCPLACLPDDQRDAFEASHFNPMLDELGSRQSQRVQVMQLTVASASGKEDRIQFLVNNWVAVQDGLYRYLAITDGSSITIRVIIREYLACEVRWSR